MRTKWNLTKSDRRAHSAYAERLRSTGIAIGADNTDSSEPPPLRINQSGRSEIYAGTLGGMALAICVRIPVFKSGIVICDHEINIPGCNAEIWLVPLEEGSLGYRVFRWLDIERAAVLNDRILGGRPLPLDRDLDGFLVAQSFGLLPRQFQSGMNIGASICLVDQSDKPYVSEVELIVERCEQRGATAKKRKGLIVPEEVLVARHQRQAHVHPESAVGGSGGNRPNHRSQ
jgi:hypothetical protein